MTERYEVIVEWDGDIRHYRIYDKEQDALLQCFASLDDAVKARERLSSHKPDANHDRRGGE